MKVEATITCFHLCFTPPSHSYKCIPLFNILIKHDVILKIYDKWYIYAYLQFYKVWPGTYFYRTNSVGTRSHQNKIRTHSVSLIGSDLMGNVFKYNCSQRGLVQSLGHRVRNCAFIPGWEKLGSTQPNVQSQLCPLPHTNKQVGEMLTTHFHVGLTLRMSGDILPLPTCLTTCTAPTLPFTFT